MSPDEHQRDSEDLLAAGDTHLGGREDNEDAILIRPDLGLFVVADGAGGHNAGNVASAIATGSVAHSIEKAMAEWDMAELDELGIPRAARQLALAVHHANREILEVARSSERHQGMGTTLLAALFVSEMATVYVAHVGDSRCYRLRDDHLELLTQDHTLVNDVLELRPDIDAASARKLPRTVVTRALGMTESLRVSMAAHRLAVGDRYLLCSDGLTDVVDPERIADILASHEEPKRQVEQLIQAAVDEGVADNIAAVVVDCDWVPPSSALRAGSPFGDATASAARRAAGVPGPRPSAAHADPMTPEIAVVVTESIPPVAPQVQTVPAAREDDDLVYAIQDFVAPDPQYGMAFREARTCPHCSKRIEASSLWCAYCGESLTG